MTLKSEAINKLRNEMESNKSNSYVQVVGQYLLQHLETNPNDGEKLLDTEKTILKSLDAMKTEASKKKIGNMAVLTPQEGFDIVAKYFGLNGIKAPENVTVTPENVTKTVESDKKTAKNISSNIEFDVSLDDFL